MKTSDFTNPNGQLVKTLQGYEAFVPKSLPPVLLSSWELTTQISEADRYLSELSGIGKTLPNPHLLIKPFIRREAVLSSRIEGTQASFSDLLYFEAADKEKNDSSDAREVYNYVKALEHGLKRLPEIPISLRLIKEMHEILMDGVRGENMTPGEFRRDQNWIGPEGCKLEDATYVPPPADQMEKAMNDLEVYIHSKSPLPPLVRLPLIHYQFEAIHPFRDGNGRIGRLLIILLLCSEGLMPKPLLYLSAYFEKNRKEYYRHLISISQNCSWLDWVLFFLKGVSEQSKDAMNRSHELLELKKKYVAKMQKAKSSALTVKLIDELFFVPMTTISRVAKECEITPRAAQLNIEKLVKEKILVEVTGKQRNRVYQASEIVSICSK